MWVRRIRDLARECYRQRSAYFMLSPNLAFFLVFALIPILWVILLTFQKGDPLKPAEYVGLSNYVSVLTDPRFWQSLKNSMYYTVLTVPSVIVLGLVLAFLLEQKIRFKNVFKGGIALPLVSPAVVAAIVWSFLLHPDLGPFNLFLRWLGMPPQNPLGNPDLVMPMIALVEIWRNLGFYMLVFIGGLQSIPTDIYEAAYIDGANKWTCFLRITIPLLRPTVLFVLVVGTIWSLQIFDSVYVMTKGGPAWASSTVVWYVYQISFVYFSMGRGATMSILLLLVTGVLSYLQFRYLRSEIEY